MKRGFTLIEIMVVVSIIGLLSSVVLASVAPTREKARDSVRTQQVRQVDLAIQFYKAKEGHVPYLGDSGCNVQNQSESPGSPLPGCIAISTQGVRDEQNELTPWGRLQEDLTPYISSLPNDPCGSACESGSDYDLGYTYVSPAAMEYYCSLDDSCTADDEWYQFYSPLEYFNYIAGINNGDPENDTYYPPPAGSIVINFNADSVNLPDDPVYPGWRNTITWSVTGTDVSCIGSDVPTYLEEGTIVPRWNTTALSGTATIYILGLNLKDTLTLELLQKALRSQNCLLEA